MKGVNALTEEQQKARAALFVMNNLGKAVRQLPAAQQDGCRQHFAELSHWAYVGDAEGALSQEIKRAGAQTRRLGRQYSQAKVEASVLESSQQRLFGLKQVHAHWTKLRAV